MNETLLITIDDFVFELYFFALIFAIYKCKKLNGTVLSIVVVIVFDYLFVKIRDPLISIVNGYYENGEYDLSLFLWFGTWAALDAILIFLLYQLHRWFNITTTLFSKVIRCVFLLFIVIQFTGYIDSKYLQSEVLDYVYTYSIPALNVSLFLFVVVWLLFLENKNDFR